MGYTNSAGVGLVPRLQLDAYNSTASASVFNILSGTNSSVKNGGILGPGVLLDSCGVEREIKSESLSDR